MISNTIIIINVGFVNQFSKCNNLTRENTLKLRNLKLYIMTKQPKYTDFKVCDILSKTSMLFVLLLSLIAGDLDVELHINHIIN